MEYRVSRRPVDSTWSQSLRGVALITVIAQLLFTLACNDLSESKVNFDRPPMNQHVHCVGFESTDRLHGTKQTTRWRGIIPRIEQGWQVRRCAGNPQGLGFMTTLQKSAVPRSTPKVSKVFCLFGGSSTSPTSSLAAWPLTDTLTEKCKT